MICVGIVSVVYELCGYSVSVVYELCGYSVNVVGVYNGHGCVLLVYVCGCSRLNLGCS